MAGRVRVLVVDDSVVVRRLVARALDSAPEIEVVGTAANGKIALTKIGQLAPDAVTMDIEMPVMDGVEAVRTLRAAGHRMPVVMFSTLTERGASATLDALAAGANDYALKPTSTGSIARAQEIVREELVPKILALTGSVRPRRAVPDRPTGAVPAPGTATPVAPDLPAPPAAREHPVRAVLIGSSTGGPQALSQVIRALPEPLPVPVLVVQHMPPVFTTQLANRLDRIGPSRVVEADDGVPLQPGTIYVAPGGRHLEMGRRAGELVTVLTDDPPVNYCRPAVDVLFGTATEVLGGDLLAVVLTGMGQDGKVGSGRVAEAGGTVLVQDQATSVVWGMPGAVAGAGLAHQVLPIEEIGAAVHRLAARTAVQA